MGGVTLDWSAAEVRDSKLTVGLRGELPPGWKESFDRTVKLLPGGDWGEVKLKKDRIRVRHVASGSEHRVHDFLESVVSQANAVCEPREAQPRDGRDADGDEPDGVDHEMTNRFRSFAGEPGD